MTGEPQPNWRTDDFDFILPPERIAQTAIEPRDHARLLHVMQSGLADKHVYDLPDLLRADDVLVMNDTKVIPARLYGKRDGVSVEVLLHKKQGPQMWLAFARPGKRLREGDAIVFAPDFAAEIIEKRESGEILIHFLDPSFRRAPLQRKDANPESRLVDTGEKQTGSRINFISQSEDKIFRDDELFGLLQKYGEPPLPPYIKREEGEAKQDAARYQTIYAAREGAVAAPTAGLHFTPELFAKLDAKGIERLKVTLHVGAGTFLPVKADYLKDHVMHAEWGEIDAATAEKINKAKRDGRRIVSVGTTSLRLLESAADERGVVRPFSNDTSIFIYPGYKFRAVDALLTNFHLPKSTLFMLVSAFAGLERMRAAYEYAITHTYRFYSYGDATLLEKA